MAVKDSAGQPERPKGGSGKRGRDPRKDAPIVATIAAGGRVEDAAKAAGVSERTAFRRLSDPDVARAIADARATIARDVLTRAATHALAAVDTLASIMADAEEPAAARIAAARTLLQTAGTYGQAAETAARIEALEDALSARKGA